MALGAVLVVSVFGALVSAGTLISARDQQREAATAILRSGTATYLFTGQTSPAVEVNPLGLPPTLAERITDQEIVTYADGESTYAAWEPEEGIVLATRLPTVGLRERWLMLTRNLILTGLVTAAAASVVGWWTADRLTARLRQITRAVATDPPEIPAVLLTGQDEIAVLAGTIERSTTALLERAQREKDLTADAAHELRTPLTALVSATELLDDSAESARVRRLVTRVRTLVDDLLLLARLDAEEGQTTVTEPIAPSQIVERALAVADLDCVVDIRSDQPVRTEPEVVARAVRNLIANAHRHGRGPVTVVVDSPELRIEDHGDGFPERLLEAGPRRFDTAGRRTAGSGLGLVIAERGLTRSGAVLRLANLPEGGARATVRFEG